MIVKPDTHTIDEYSIIFKITRGRIKPALTGREYQVLMSLITNRDCDNYICDISNKKLSQEMICSKTTISSALNGLVNKKYLRSTKVYGIGVQHWIMHDIKVIHSAFKDSCKLNEIKSNSQFVFHAYRQEFLSIKNPMIRLKNVYGYLIECMGYYKIGISEKYKSRINDLQVGNPFKINKIHIIEYNTRQDALDVERSLHHMFNKKHVRGEWYKLEKEDVEYIKSL